MILESDLLDDRHHSGVATLANENGNTYPTVVFLSDTNEWLRQDGTCQARLRPMYYAFLVGAACDYSAAGRTFPARKCSESIWAMPFESTRRNDWVKTATSNDRELSLEQMRTLIDELNQMLESGNHASIETELQSVDFDHFSKDAIVAIFRSLYSSRSLFESWESILSLALESLHSRGMSAESIKKLV